MEFNQNRRFKAVLMDDITHQIITLEPLDSNPAIRVKWRLNRERRTTRFEANNRPNCVLHRTFTLSRMVCFATSMPKFI